VTFNLNLNTDSPSSWVKCNLNQAGFYRVNYPPSNWKQLAKMLRTTPVQVASHFCNFPPPLPAPRRVVIHALVVGKYYSIALSWVFIHFMTQTVGFLDFVQFPHSVCFVLFFLQKISFWAVRRLKNYLYALHCRISEVIQCPCVESARHREVLALDWRHTYSTEHKSVELRRA